MGDRTALLALLQIADSAFPAGGFAHSSGLEQLTRDGLVRDADALGRFVRSLLRLSLATCDAVVTATCADAVLCRDLEAILEADRAYLRMKAPSELRHASASMGARFLEEVVLHEHHEVLLSLQHAVREHRTPGSYPAMFGAVAGALGAPGVDAAAALMLAAATSLLQAGMRLLRVSHRDGQATLHALRHEIGELAETAARTPIVRLSAFHPRQEIASMRHRIATVRLFAS